MEIKRIIGLCKKSGMLHLIENEGVQWLSDGYSMYPLFDLPRFDEETICRTYDISEKKAAKMTIRYDLEAPAAFDLSDDVPDEVACDYDDELFGGVIPVQTSQGVVFIRRDHLSPFNDTARDTLYLFERHSPKGGIYFAVKVGFMLMGIVLPYNCINDRFVERIERVCEQVKIALSNQKEAEKRKGEENNGTV